MEEGRNETDLRCTNLLTSYQRRRRQSEEAKLELKYMSFLVQELVQLQPYLSLLDLLLELQNVTTADLMCEFFIESGMLSLIHI